MIKSYLQFLRIAAKKFNRRCYIGYREIKYFTLANKLTV